MQLVLACFAALVVLLGTLIRPKLAAVVVWFVLFTYPHAFWRDQNWLPLNVGVDDLFCLLFFYAVVLRRHLIERLPVRLEAGLWIVTVFAVIVSIATLSGMQVEGVPDTTPYIKDILKIWVSWGLFYALLHCIDDLDDVVSQIKAFVFAAAAGGAIVIAQYFEPRVAQIFGAPLVLETRIIEIGSRAGGAFMNPNVAGCVLAVAAVLAVGLGAIEKSALTKRAVMLCIAGLLVAILATGSRTAVVALSFVGAFVLMTTGGRARKWGRLALAAAITIVVLFAEMRESLVGRFQDLNAPIRGDSGLQSRLDIWSDYLGALDVKTLALGRGWRAGVHEFGFNTHSVYVALGTIYGLSGLLWAGATALLLLSRIRAIQTGGSAASREIVRPLAWAFLVWSICGLSLDVLSGQYGSLVLFYLIVLTCRLSGLSRVRAATRFGNAGSVVTAT